VRGIRAALLVFEGLVILFATLVARSLSDVDHAVLWWVGGGGAVLALVLAGLLRRPWAVVAASVLQLALVAAGVVVPVMFFLGLLFGALWFLALYLGRRVEQLQAAAAAGEPDQPPPPAVPGPG
jgi:uncharacterized protein DUF4233